MVKKILVVDDDESILEVLQLILEDEGYMVITSDNGDIIELVEDAPPDLILLDVLLSGKDGREIARKLKEDIKTQAIPIIIISAHPTASVGSLSSGVDGFLSKPFDIKELLGAVKKTLAKSSPLSS